MSKYLDIDYLKQLNIEPQWFGLGFIQMKINEDKRLHFWHPKLSPNPGNAEEVHNHRYDFTSSVLKGEIDNEIWELCCDPHGDYRLWRVLCQPGNADAAEMIGPMSVTTVTTRKIKTNGTYAMSQPIFHRSFPIGHTVTLLRRGKVTESHAHVIRYHDAQHSCPFSFVMNSSELWKHIAEILNA